MSSRVPAGGRGVWVWAALAALVSGAPATRSAVTSFGWSAIPASQRAGVAFPVAVTARDGAGNVATDFTSAVALTAVSRGTPTTLFSDGFDDGNYAGWTLGTGGYTVAVTTATYAKGSRSLSLLGGTQHHFDGVSTTLAKLVPDQMEFYVRGSATNKSGGYLAAGPDTASLVLMFHLDATATMGVWENGNWHATPFAANRWYKIGFRLDWTAKTLDFYVNDSLIEGRIPFRTASAAQISAIYLYNYHSTQSWFDELLLGRDGADTPVGLAPTQTGPFVNGAWSGSVRVQSEAANVTVVADDGQGHTGTSGVFNVGPAPRVLHHFAWGAIPSPQRAGVAFPVTLTAQDVAGQTVTEFRGSVPLHAEAGPGTTVFFEDGFETGGDPGWSAGSGYTRTVTTQTAAVGTHSLSLTGGNRQHFDGPSHPLADLRPDRIEFRVRSADATKNGAYLVVGAAPAATSSAVFFFLREDGTLGLTENNNWHYAPYEPLRWYKVTLRLDWTAKSVDFYLDDTLQEVGIPFRAPSLQKLTALYLYNLDSTQVWWDGLRVYNEGPTTPATVTPALSGYFVSGVWQGQLTLAAAASNVVLQADEGLGRVGHGGFSGPIVVQSWPPQVDHLSWSPIGSPQAADAPFVVSVAAKDVAGVTVSNATSALNLTARSASGLAVLFGEDFEAGLLGGWAASGSSYTAEITVDTAADGARSLRLTGSSPEPFQGLAHALPGLRPDRIDFRLRATATDRSAGLAVGSGPSRDRTAVVFSLDATGRMGPRTPSQGYVTTYAPNRWYSISLRLDWTAKRLSFFADDRQVATGVPFYGSGVDRLLAVYLYNADATTVGWDGIRFLQAQTPLPVGVTPGTAPRLANGVWNGTVTVPSVAGDAILKAEDDTGHTGESGPFDLHSDRLDTDGDGLPDAWELAWGLDPATPGDATADADQDGLADAREFAAGTSPRDPGSLLRLLPPRLQGDDLILSAVAGAGVRLEVEVSGALGGDWTPAGSAVGAGDPVELRIPGAAATSPRFYRVRVQP